MPATEGVRVEGLRELNQAFARISKDLAREMRGELRNVAEPVRAEAQQLAAARIRNIGQRWARMRVGVTQKLVYVAPRQRGVRSGARRRPNLAPLLMDRAMQPALDRHAGEVVKRLDQLLGRLGGENGF